MKANTIAKRKSRLKPETQAREFAYRRSPRHKAASRDARQSKYSTAEGWVRYTLASIKHRSRRRGLVFDIEASDISDIPSTCPVLGVRIEIRSGGRGKGNPNSPSVDRIDNSKGYVKGNVKIISLRANLLKKDGSAEELRLVAKYAEECESLLQ